MRKWLLVAVVLAGCGSETPASLVGGTWHMQFTASDYQDLEFTEDGRYRELMFALTIPRPAPELGAWSTATGQLQLTPDATPAGPAMDFEVTGDHLKIWWPAHLLREYARQ